MNYRVAANRKWTPTCSPVFSPAERGRAPCETACNTAPLTAPWPQAGLPPNASSPEPAVQLRHSSRNGASDIDTMPRGPAHSARDMQVPARVRRLWGWPLCQVLYHEVVVLLLCGITLHSHQLNDSYSFCIASA